MIYLLDVSVLVARLDSGHEMHAPARTWTADKALAVCPITELGAVRVLCQTTRISYADARKVLKAWLDVVKPEFVPCDQRALDGHAPASHKDSTDFYLGNLAEAHGMKWATLDAESKHPAAALVA